MITEDRAANIPRVFLPVNFHDVGAKWRFYTTKHDRLALWQRTTYYSGAVADLAAAPTGAVAVVPIADAGSSPVDGWSNVRVVKNLVDEPTLKVIRRD
jgi:hypothetical protein